MVRILDGCVNFFNTVHFLLKIFIFRFDFFFYFFIDGFNFLENRIVFHFLNILLDFKILDHISPLRLCAESLYRESCIIETFFSFT